MSEYTERVNRYLEGCEYVSVGGCPGCKDCGIPEDSDNYVDEAYFSWSPCEICGSHLGGHRHAWHCVIDGKIVHGSCCTDCMFYIANGDEPKEY